jgi:hypothetical protein
MFSSTSTPRSPLTSSHGEELVRHSLSRFTRSFDIAPAFPLGYRTFCCSDCRRSFNERTGTPFNYLEYPTDIVLFVVFWRLRYELSLRDLAEMFLYPMRGFGNVESAAHFWRAFDELRNYFRPRHTMGETVSLAQQRQLFCERLAGLQALMVAASSPSGSGVRVLQHLPVPLRVLSSDASLYCIPSSTFG